MSKKCKYCDRLTLYTICSKCRKKAINDFVKRGYHDTPYPERLENTYDTGNKNPSKCQKINAERMSRGE